MTDISPAETARGRGTRRSLESATENTPFPSVPSALVIAHPGHELRVHGWMCRTRPFTFILTDGSGRSGKPRLDPTSKILCDAGATPGGLYGRLTDREAYALVLNRQFDVFVGLAEELAGSLVEMKVESVAGDAIEGYNPIHDICRFIANSAVALAEKEMGKRIANFDFPLAGDPSTHGDADPDSIRLNLDHHEFERKLAAAQGYAELADEVGATFDKFGADRFRYESLRPVREAWPEAWTELGLPAEPPFYESFGQSRVATGHYKQVIRYREHVRPLAEALARRAGFSPGV
ncbi:MAG TPA: hypothetical protein VI756_00170 [Blastocatellia bacterium]